VGQALWGDLKVEDKLLIAKMGGTNFVSIWGITLLFCIFLASYV
jgi:hypothetical protein